jgi:hypothetical protein
MTRWLVTVAAVAWLAVPVGGSEAARTSACAVGVPCATPVVPSLEPAATQALWRRLVRRPRRLNRTAQCRPLRGVFYAATDWLRLATKLAANASPCASYYVSVPPVNSDKTMFRPDQASRIRALGTNFHALAEVHYTAWSRWVASTSSSWFAAGAEARRRMATAGFDVEKGDSWALNEITSAVRQGAGDARANARELIRGLYEGDGGPKVRGAVFIVGIGQSTASLSVYQRNLQNWLADTAFWSDMAAYVSDWSQEVYGDIRRYAVPGAPIELRRDHLNDYLQHELVLARIAPSTAEPARSYLPAAYSPLASAAWQWESGYGWTNVPVDLMRSFVSAQVYALRFFSATSPGAPPDHWGFAWQPRNGSGLPASEFTAQTGSILDRLAAAVRDSAEPSGAPPGSEACGPGGQNVSCPGDLAGATFTESWKTFLTWSQAVLGLVTPPQTLTAGTPSPPITLGLFTSAGTPLATVGPVAVTLSSSSAQGRFSLSPAGPWSTTLVVTIPAGATQAPPFFYLDTVAGRPTITATAAVATTVTQIETVQAGAPAKVVVAPAASKLTPRSSRRFASTLTDAFGNAVTAPATWSVIPPSLGSVAPRTGSATRFTAGGRGGTAFVAATVAGAAGPVSGRAKVAITPGTVRVSTIRYAARARTRVTARIVDGAGGPVRAARLSVVVRRDGRWFFSGRGLSGSDGHVTFSIRARSGCYRTTVRSLFAAGYRWNEKTPANRFCR